MEEREKREGEERENIAEPLGCFFVCLVKRKNAAQTQRDLRENNVA